ncbi:MAG: YeeE/YedE family protein [Saccharospirillum sp.]|jgi:uncharacterized membrane protein YedE/YeeE
MLELAEFNALTSFVGGLVIGFAALLLYLLRGDVAGINGMVTGLMSPVKGEWSWRLLFVVGLVLGGLVYQALGGGLTRLEPVAHGGLVIVAGLLVGIGATVGSGCTSGHGICGISRWSIRSIAATITFVTAAMLTVFVIRHLVGGA